MVEDMNNLFEELKAKKSEIFYITEVAEQYIVGVNGEKRIYQKNEYQPKKINYIYTEKDALNSMFWKIKNALITNNLQDEQIDDLRNKVESVIKRCVDVGYHAVGLEYISLLGQGRLATKSAKQEQIDEKVKNYLMETVSGYAMRSITCGKVYKDRVINNIIKPMQSLKFGEKASQIPIQEFVDRYNKSNFSVRDYDSQDDKLIKISPLDQILSGDLEKVKPKEKMI